MSKKSIVVMGVSGAGKTTIGRLLATKLNCPFYDADDFHSETNIRKMSSGIPLSDADRSPWLEKLKEVLSGQSCVMACSALKNIYREKLGATHYVYLAISKDEVIRRLKNRIGHFMPSTLIDSQFDTLEVPENVIQLDASQPAELIIEEAIRHLSEET